ncbi:homoserine kinase [Entomobacter blattae]|uniref:Homoserine kinase n=1 Tax=Entomobacter blattae TaxID=2762277 RepID=A0A7H1NNI8_9PROT|nr:homoserine kinase [Entomobacter blattae]QNT77348.1 Homoserine kinase [Entomobacter blattae]
MAVYTNLAEEKLRAFLLLFDVGELLTFSGISEGVENSNFFVQTTRARYILTLFEKRVSSQDLPWFMELMQFLHAQGIHCPRPVMDRSGTIIHLLEGRPATLTTFLNGQWKKNPHQQDCRALGVAMAKFHWAGKGFVQERLNSVGIHTWRGLWAQCEEKAEIFEAGLSTKIGRLLTTVEQQWPSQHAGLPRGQIHADLFPDNVFFEGDVISGIIDFYFACTDFLAYDVAIALNAWCFDKSFLPENVKALLDGYRSVRHFQPQEWQSLPILCLGAALRFFLTRLHDWFATPEGAHVIKKDPREYMMKLDFFSQQRDFLVAFQA